MFGRKLCVTSLQAELARRTGAPISMAFGRPAPDGRLIVKILPRKRFPREATLREITQWCYDRLEEEARAHPELWLWSYKHWRYLPKDEPEPARYPFYANPSGWFEKRRRLQAEAEEKQRERGVS
jgi:lauroyl/myristoyl acyltransferase